MSTLPALEAALDAAAHRHYAGGRARRRRPAVAAPVLALAAVALAVALLPGRVAAPPPQAPAAVPEQTVALARALTLAPVRVPFQPGDPAIPHAQLAAVAAEYRRDTPYPPGLADTFDWRATPADPHDMASINFRTDVQSLVEYRAACLWLRFWDLAYVSADGPALTAATAVLAAVPAWPSFRGPQSDDASRHWSALAERAAARDAAPLREEAARNCDGVVLPGGAAVAAPARPR